MESATPPGPGGDAADLLAAADAARTRAYCPYSGFAVGAAIRTADGTVVTGANVENASYSLTICAERSAAAAAVAAGHTRFDVVAISVEGDSGEPCGACRQVLAEFGTRVVLFRSAGQVVELAMEDLLPHAFHGRSLDP